MENITTSITPFIHSKTRLNLNTSTQKYDNKRQVTALMPNLIRFLQASSMQLLHRTFYKHYPGCEFLSVHVCFADTDIVCFATTDNVKTLKTILASVYT